MENTEEIDALFRYAAEGILFVHQQGIVVRINPGAEHLFRYGNDELAGRRIETLVPDRFKTIPGGYRHAYANPPHARVMGSGSIFTASSKTVRSPSTFTLLKAAHNTIGYEKENTAHRGQCEHLRYDGGDPRNCRL